MSAPSPDLISRMTRWRQHLHSRPETANEEVETARFIATVLTELGIPFESGIGGHGLVATLHRPGDKAAVGLRADIDALPIEEATGLPYASQISGKMHACGHDGHTASLLGAAVLLQNDPSWSGTVHLIFQPAEEGSYGALAMLADGLLERFPMQAVFAYHNWPGLAAGEIAVHPRAVMAGDTRISISLTGQSGHAAMPHEARDGMVAAAQILTALQAIPARMIDAQDACVISITKVVAGEAFNQIAEKVQLTGTMRTLERSVREAALREITRISEGIAAAFDLQAEVSFRIAAEPVINAPEGAEIAALAATRAGASLRQDLRASMAGEDFAHILQRCPGALVWIGNGEASPRLHTPDYNYNDAILPVAARWYAEVAREALRR